MTDQEKRDKISTYLKNARRALNKNQFEMAELFGVAHGTYVKWERGTREPSSAAVRLISLVMRMHKMGFMVEFKDSDLFKA